MLSLAQLSPSLSFLFSIVYVSHRRNALIKKDVRNAHKPRVGPLSRPYSPLLISLDLGLGLGLITKMGLDHHHHHHHHHTGTFQRALGFVGG